MDQYLGRKLALRAFGLVGASIFAAFFVLTFVTPNWVETFATEFTENETRHRVEKSIDSFRLLNDDSSLSGIARSVDKVASPELEKWIKELHDGVRTEWELALESIRDLDCECRERLSQVLEENFRLDPLHLMALEDQIFEFIQLNYSIVVNELKRDIRTFSASNAAVFVLLLLVSFLKPQAITHLFLPGVLLGMSTLICSYFYIFEQNWLLTIIHSSYLGFAYLAWLGVVFLFLCDIVFNRGRVTTEILNAIFNAIGSAFSVDPEPTFGNSTNSMKIPQELRNSIDARLAIIATITSLGGFAIAHWNGLRLAGESKYGGAFAKLHYDLAFYQAVWVVFAILMVAGISIGITTGRNSNESRRLATQLLIAAAIFCVLNFVLHAFHPIGTQ